MNLPAKALTIAVVALGVGAFVLFANSRSKAAQPTFIPNQANDKLLIAKGWQTAELNKIMNDFQSSYQDRLHSSFNVKSDPVGHDHIRVTFPNDIEPMLFHFLVNYVRYPRDFDISKRTIIVLGKVTLDHSFVIPNTTLIGQKAQIYVPADDHEFDLVYVKTEQGVIYENSFAASSWKLAQNPRLPSGIEALK